MKWLPISPRMRRRLLSRIYENEYRNAIAAAHAKKDRAKVEELEQGRIFDEQEAYEWEEVQFTQSMLRTARKLRVETPPRPVYGQWQSDFWVLSQSQGSLYLTGAGIAKLREDISLCGGVNDQKVSARKTIDQLLRFGSERSEQWRTSQLWAYNP
jgi:hypothetical protein